MAREHWKRFLIGLKGLFCDAETSILASQSALIHADRQHLLDLMIDDANAEECKIDLELRQEIPAELEKFDSLAKADSEASTHATKVFCSDSLD